jgi:hypothetical protein
MVLEWRETNNDSGPNGAELVNRLRGEDVRDDSSFLRKIRQALDQFHQLTIPFDPSDPTIFSRLIDRLYWHNAARDGSSRLAHDDDQPLLLRTPHNYPGRTTATLAYTTAQAAYLEAKRTILDPSPDLKQELIDPERAQVAFAALEIAQGTAHVRAAVKGVNALFYKYMVDHNKGGFTRAAGPNLEEVFLKEFRRVAHIIGVKHHPLVPDVIIALSKDKMAHMIGRSGDYREGILRSIARPESEQ